MIRQERDVQQMYSRLRDELQGSGDIAPDAIPFAIRYRYGIHLGWDIPTAIEWEKAYRGADFRALPWGSPESGYANVKRKGALPLPRAMALTTVKDESPYGILHMAGNLSEWIRVVDDPFRPRSREEAWRYTFPDRVFLKGGNYLMDASSCGPANSLSFPAEDAPAGGYRAAWTGFRVVQRLRPRGPEKAGYIPDPEGMEPSRSEPVDTLNVVNRSDVH
jgi:hypothetical protein